MIDSWSLLKINPQRQELYLRLLHEYRPEVVSYFPVFTCMARPHGMRRAMEITRPVYPGYIFIRVDASTDLSGPVHLPVRARWVKFGGRVEVVPDRVIEELKRLAGNGELVREVKYVCPFRSGVAVRVHLPVYDLAGIVVKLVRGERVMVETSLCRVTVPVCRLEVM